MGSIARAGHEIVVLVTEEDEQIMFSLFFLFLFSLLCRFSLSSETEGKGEGVEGSMSSVMVSSRGLFSIKEVRIERPLLAYTLSIVFFFLVLP